MIIDDNVYTNTLYSHGPVGDGLRMNSLDYRDPNFVRKIAELIEEEFDSINEVKTVSSSSDYIMMVLPTPKKASKVLRSVICINDCALMSLTSMCSNTVLGVLLRLSPNSIRKNNLMCEPVRGKRFRPRYGSDLCEHNNYYVFQ